MSRTKEAVFMGIGILAGLALSGPSAQAAEARSGQGQGQNHKRRYRSHHRRKPGGGQQ